MGVTKATGVGRGAESCTILLSKYKTTSSTHVWRRYTMYNMQHLQCTHRQLVHDKPRKRRREGVGRGRREGEERKEKDQERGEREKKRSSRKQRERLGGRGYRLNVCVCVYVYLSIYVYNIHRVHHTHIQYNNIEMCVYIERDQIQQQRFTPNLLITSFHTYTTAELSSTGELSDCVTDWQRGISTEN